ncbi:MAG TPA: SH3 domain-containing protein, partial [Anaerolineales bacterium]|nr:SH3 domain-containing protein [Anaerolineales bacterium]
MTSASEPKSRKKINWAPYLLILPSLLYLAAFFGWPMVQGLILAIREEGAALSLRSEANRNSTITDQLPRGMQVSILSRQGNPVPPGETLQGDQLTEVWFRVRGQDTEGQLIEGWTPERRIRVRESDENGAPVAGTVRSILSASADPLTRIYAQADESSEVLGQMEARTAVEILEQTSLELWFLISGEAGNQTIEGWVPSRYLNVFDDEAQARIEEGDTGQFTTRYLERMVNDRFFWPALRTTLLLIVLIIPAQFVLAIIMALVIQADLKGSGIFLYIFAIALGVSDLAVGILWYSVFTQSGYLNSILQGLGLINSPNIYLSADTRYWILIAIWLAELWRATAIVMVIVVAG